MQNSEAVQAPLVTPLRADAARNRQKILDVAARLFAERGIEVTLNDIAHEAGVGVGTVYRKFADKNAIMEELTERKLHRMLELVSTASSQEAKPITLRELMLSAAAMRAADRGLFPMLFRADDTTRRDARVSRLLHAWDEVISRARAEGTVRPGFSSIDIGLFILMVGTVADATRDLEPTAWERAAEVLLDGYAAQPAEDGVIALSTDDETQRRIFFSG